jgi:predicted small metal-binding protein
MADHVFPKADGKCSECGVHAKDAHRVACIDHRTVDVAKASSKPKALKSRPAGSCAFRTMADSDSGVMADSIPAA